MTQVFRTVGSGRASFCAALGLVIWAWSVTARAAEPAARVEPGTVLEITALGIPEFRYKVAVNAAGEVAFPLLDPMQVEGMAIDDLRAKVRRLLSTKVFRQRTRDGQENMFTIAPDEVTLDVAEYRPVYISGDVGKPGELGFRPGLTVRQAVALAGGYDVVRSRIVNPFMEAADIRSEYEAAWIDLIKQQAQMLGTQALLDDKPFDGLGSRVETPLPDSVAARIVETEVARVKAMGEDFKKELEHLRTVVQQTESQLNALQEDQKTQQAVMRQQSSDVDRIRALYEKNIVPVNRVSDEQRQMAFAQERLLAIGSQIAQAARQREDAGRQVQVAADQRRLKLLGQAQDAAAKVATIRARIRSLQEKLAYTSTAKSQLARGYGTPLIVVHRKQGEVPQSISVEEDTPLRAGDVVDVIVKSAFPDVD